MKKHIYFSLLTIAMSTACLNQTVSADAVFDPQTQPIIPVAPYILKSTNLEEGNTKAYRTWFEMGTWQGDIIEYNVSKNGILTTDVTNLEENPPLAAGQNWSARATMAAKESADTNYWTSQRKIITSISGTDQQAFRWGNLTKDQQKELDNKNEGQIT